MIRAALLSLCLAGPVMAQSNITLLEFDQLDGWNDDDHDQALDVFLNTCRDLDDPDWTSLCQVAGRQPDAKAFFELFFRPVLIEDDKDALFTGYFEPELRGSLTRDETFRFPLYRLPPEIKRGTPWLTRREMEETDVLAGRGLEIVWIDDPVDVFFLQVQGSGRVKLNTGGGIRVGYGGANGHSYSSVGAELIARGIYEPHQVSAQVIQNWVKRNPEDGADLLRTNDSYVFFREVNEVPADKGPLGAMNRSITTDRSVAVDPAFVTLGGPVWLEKDGRTPIRRLMIAQDTGSAIKGAQRADIFFGTGDEAGRLAGQIKDGGRLVQLVPIQRAYAMATGDDE
ncbi:MAG: MltA domain-containing protein [Paracoccaceae bacterium]|nr:MltA domain-containing protein [Paracoccaceae bacterium]